MTDIYSNLSGFDLEDFNRSDSQDPNDRAKSINPYFQRPPLEGDQPDAQQTGDRRLVPHRLFYLFTAQVIQQDQVFIR